MTLPDSERAQVDRTKIVDYLPSTSHPDGRSKAAFFGRFGFKAEEWEMFAIALKEHGASNTVTSIVESPHGTRYTVDGRLRTPDGRSPPIRTVWIVERENPPRLITAHPL